MQFIVPQFIDIEDKVIGPFTFKQFTYLAGGLGLAFTVYKLLPKIIAFPLGIGIIVLAAALTFYKINGKPFVFILQAFISFFFQSKLYIWRQKIKREEKTEETKPKETEQAQLIPRLTDSQLSDLSWSLDILDMKEKGE